MKINISQINVCYQNGKLELKILNNDNIDYNKTALGTVSNLEDFDKQILDFLHQFIEQD